jgi:hypothetical protein
MPNCQPKTEGTCHWRDLRLDWMMKTRHILNLLQPAWLSCFVSTTTWVYIHVNIYIQYVYVFTLEPQIFIHIGGSTRQNPSLVFRTNGLSWTHTAGTTRRGVLSGKAGFKDATNKQWLMFCYCVIPSQITISACVCWDVFCFCSHLSPQFISFPRLYADVCIPIEVLESPVGKAHLSILAVEGARVLGLQRRSIGGSLPSMI